MAHDEPIAGPYRLSAVDIDEQMSVQYDLGGGSSVGRIGPTVFEVGSNDDYIVAARHPGNNRSITQYYYIVRKLDEPLADPSAAVRGPFDIREFQEATRRLGLPSLNLRLEDSGG